MQNEKYLRWLEEDQIMQAGRLPDSHDASSAAARNDTSFVNMFLWKDKAWAFCSNETQFLAPWRRRDKDHW